jgi:cytochrome P450
VTDPFIEMLGSENPLPMLHALRASDPVHKVEPLGFWLVTKHEDVKRLFHDPENVTHDKRAGAQYVHPPVGTMRRWSNERSIFAVDPEEHARLRRLVSSAFTPRAIRRMNTQIREVIERIAAPLRNRPGEVIDLVGDLTNVVPNSVISCITGVPPGDDELRFRRIAQAFIQGALPFTSPEVQRESEAGFRELAAWVREMVAKRRAHPEEDLVTDLVQAQDADDSLSEDDIVLLGAGSEATASVMTSIAHLVIDEPEALEPLRRDRDRIRRSTDEILRYSYTLPSGTMRFAIRDFELRGKQIQSGQMIMLSFGGANRDPEVFEDPDRLDLERPMRDLLIFGNGPHYCLGANLAREEIGAVLDALLDIVPPGSSVCSEALEYKDMGIMRRATNLPVRIAPLS